MRYTRPYLETVELLAFLAKAPMARVLPFSKISRFTRDEIVCAADRLSECAYLVLTGRCEQRIQPPHGTAELLQTFQQGDTFGLSADAANPSLVVVAMEDCVVLGIPLLELSALSANESGTETASSSRNSSPPDSTFFFKAPAGKLTVLAFMSTALPAELLGRQIARRLHIESGGPVIQVHLVARDSSSNSERNPVDCTLNGELSDLGPIREHEDGAHVLRVGLTSDAPNPDALAALFQRLRRRFRHVLVDAAVEIIPPDFLFGCIAQSSSTCFFLRHDAGDLYRMDLLLHELHLRLNGAVPVEMNSILCLAANETMDGFDTRIERTGLRLRSIIRGCPRLADPREPASISAPSESFHPDVNRVARDLGNCLVGLALSSGGAKGFAHAGVIQVLEENNIEVDVVAGASMGAYIGALWAFGCNGAKLEELAHEMKARRAFWSLIDPVFPPRQGFLHGLAVKQRLQRTIGDAQFGDLLRPLRVVATNLDTLERKVFTKGDVATAVHASIAVPGVCVPVRIGDEAFIDGGIVDPLPTDVLHEMGVHRIIAVNTIRTPDRIRQRLEREREVEMRKRHRTAEFARQLVPINEHLNYFARGNILDILVHAIHGGQIQVAEQSCRLASIVLRPETDDDRWLDFRKPEHHLKAGRDVALEQLDEIKRLMKPKGTVHEHQTPARSMAPVVG